MMTISKIVGMISFVREKFVQNMVRTVENVREEIVVHVSSQLQWRSQKFSTGGASICSNPFCPFPFSCPTKSAVQSKNVVTYHTA